MVCAALLHLVEQAVSLHILVYKAGLADSLFHDVVLAFVLKSEIVLCVENADNVVHALAAHRERGMTGAVYGLLPDADIIVAPEHVDVCTVSADLFRGHIVKGENVLDYAVLVLVDSTLFRACVGHHENLFLGDCVVVAVGINAHEAQYTVCGDVQQPYQRCEENCHEVYDSAHGKSYLLGILHSKAFGYQFSENQSKIGKHQCNKNYRCLFDNSRRYPYACFDQRRGKKLRKAVCGKSGAYEACKGDSHLNSSKESCRRIGKLFQSRGFFVAAGGKLFKPHIACGDDRHLRTGEKRVQRDKYYLQNYLP